MFVFCFLGSADRFKKPTSSSLRVRQHDGGRQEQRLSRCRRHLRDVQHRNVAFAVGFLQLLYPFVALKGRKTFKTSPGNLIRFYY